MTSQVKIEENTLRFLCQIENISSYNGKIDSKILSETVNYCSKSGKKSQWRLKFYPYGCTECHNCASLFLELMESDEIAVRTEKVRFSILHGFTKKLIREMDPREFNVNTGGWGYNFFIGHKVLFNLEDNWVPNDTLSIACKIQFSSDESTREALPIESEIGLIYAEKDSFVAGQLSDMALLVDSRIINVQKQILAAGSSVFELKVKDLGSQFNILEIGDFSFDVIFELVRFMYTGKVELLVELNMELFAAAAEYDLPTLKDICAKELARNMTLDNCIEILGQADRYKCPVLKKYTIVYIKSHYEELSESDIWQKDKSLTEYLIKCISDMLIPEPTIFD